MTAGKPNGARQVLIRARNFQRRVSQLAIGKVKRAFEFLVRARDLQPKGKFIEINTQSTRLFPKNTGAAAYRLTGIAARCDWAILTDGGVDGADVSLRGDFSRQPRTVFLSLRSFFHAIPYFYEEILPKIDKNFVLITGSEDITLPNQVDARFRPFNSKEKEIIDRIIKDERLIHWFAENRDEIRPKMSSLPLGFHPVGKNKLPIAKLQIKDRPLRVLCAHRMHKGAQYEARWRVTRLCEERFQEFSTILREEVPHLEYYQLVQQYPFVLCVHGGGLDPSPKAWGCIAHGSIPIIKSSVLDDAYSQLPVAFVDDWNENCLSLQKLRAWVEELAHYYDSEQFRAETLYKLSVDYWWDRIASVSNPVK